MGTVSGFITDLEEQRVALGSKRRRAEDEDLETTVVPDDLPPSKRQKSSTQSPANSTSGNNETTELVKIGYRKGSVSLVAANGINSREGEPDMDSVDDASTSQVPGVSSSPEPSLVRITGEYLNTLANTKMSRQSKPRPSTVGRSHHPTPPSTNVQSPSIHSPSTDSGPSMLTAQAEGKRSSVPTESRAYVNVVTNPRPPSRHPALTSRDQAPLASAKPPLFASASPTPDPIVNSPSSPRRTADLHELTTKPPPRRSQGGGAGGKTLQGEDGEDESGSDGPFGSLPSSRRRIEVIRGLPKHRRETSFRGTNLVRERKVVSRNQNSFRRDATSHRGSDDGGVRSHKSVPDVQKAQAEKHSLNQPRPSDAANTTPSAKSIFRNDTINQRFNRFASRKSRHVDSGQQNGVATKSTSIPTSHVPHPIRDPGIRDVPEDNSSPSHYYLKEDHTPIETEVTDVFKTRTPIRSSSSRDPYVLNTAHLAESSTSSSAIRAQLDSPIFRHMVPRDKARRRTFAGFHSRSSLPNVDLMEKLGKRASTRRLTLFRSRRTSLDHKPNSDSVASISPTSIFAPEHRVTHHRPPRSSVIPVVVDPESRHTTPALLNGWSPSTCNLVIRAGLAAIFKRMEENHGFSASVVRRAWIQQNMDLDATDRMLLRMRIAAENASRGDDYEEQRHGLSSNKALEGGQIQSLAPSPDDTAPDPDAFSDDYTPPVRSRAAHYLHLSEHGHREARQREIELVSHGPSQSSSRKIILSPPVWRAEDDEVLRSGDEARLESLSNKFSEDTVRRRFLVVMRESRIIYMG